jgi:hypothetical protein
MTTLTTADLDRGHALAAHASPGPYTADLEREGPAWDEEQDEPIMGGWVEGPDYLDCDEYVLLRPEDAAYFAWLEPERVRELIRLARVGMNVEQAQADVDAADVAAHATRRKPRPFI